MAFKEPVVIHKSNSTKVYINQCHTKGKKTRLFAVRRDDSTGLAYHLGSIKWNARWRQYVFNPSNTTFWSAGCLLGVIEFLKKINKEERLKWKKKRTGKK